ncbi:MAG TPA: DUF6531 domain-containing protein, partial [Candidatus Methylacidiphilales bacterium]
TLRSVAGAASTVIDAQQSGQTFVISKDAVIDGFSLINGAAGAVSVTGANVKLINDIVRNNVANGAGAALSVSSGSVTAINSTFFANKAATGYSGSVLTTSHGAITLLNSILWDGGSEISNDSATGLATVTATYSDIQGSYAGTGNLNADPRLRSDGHILAGSPCIDAGTTAVTVTRDMDGEARPVGAGYDMGADEYKDADGNGLPDWWELKFIGHTGNDANAFVSNGSGLTLAQAYQQGVDPVTSAAYTISLTTSGAGTAPSTVTLTANVSGATSTIQRVDFYQGQSFLGSGSSVPFTCVMPNLPAGNYGVTAVSFDANGRSATATASFQVAPLGTTAISNWYTRGVGSNPDLLSSIIALDFEKGILLDPTGTNASKFPNGLPWFAQLATETVSTNYHVTPTGYNLAFTNPLVAFGAAGGGSPLDTNQNYRFGVLAGTQQVLWQNSIQQIAIDIYSPDATYTYSDGSVGPLATYYISLPQPGTVQWAAFAAHGYVADINLKTDGGNPNGTMLASGAVISSSTVFFGLPLSTDGVNTADLDTQIQFIPAQASTDQWGRTVWTDASGNILPGGPLQVTHRAGNAHYQYRIRYYGIRTDNGGSPMTMATSNPSSPNQNVVSCVAYTLDFTTPSPWASSYISQPHFQGTPLPSAYLGKSLDELIHGAPAVVDSLSAPSASLLTVDNSPELKSHPILDQFVASMGNNPLALANYVQNEIGLTDAIGYNANGSITDASINPTGVSRDALATFQEGQGSPAEQCALLVYMLRKAGVPAAYIFPQTDGTLMFDQQLSHLLRMQISGAQNNVTGTGATYATSTPNLIPVNYPWVAAYVDGKWVHLFPWMKDTAVEEGYDIAGYLPTGYQTGTQWLQHYLLDDPLIRSLNPGNNDAVDLFRNFVANSLKNNYPNVNISQVGVNIYDRKNNFTDWSQFPRPWQTPAISSANLKENLAAIPNIFDTVSIQVYSDRNGNGSPDSGEPILSTGDLRMVDLHNRRLLFYAQQTGTNTHNMILSLEPYRPSATETSAFNESTLLGKQTISTGLNSSDDAIQFAIDYKRHRQISSSSAPTTYWPLFLGFYENLEVKDSRPLRKGDMAALCLDYGRVTSKMIEAQTEKYQAYQQQSGSGTVDPETASGTPLYLMGQTYYYKMSQLIASTEALTKTQAISWHAHGFSKLGPTRNSDGSLPNNGQITLNHPKVDMSFLRTAVASNSTLHPDSGEDGNLPFQNMAAVITGIGSALEHETINQFFQQNDAISTVRLLDKAQGSTPGSGVVQLTSANYASQGNVNYTYGGQTKTLQQWAGNSVWASVSGALASNAPNSQFTTVYITPGPQVGASGQYVGMGAFIVGVDSFSALITDSFAMNGGYGGTTPYTYPSIPSQPDPTYTSYVFPSSSGGVYVTNYGVTSSTATYTIGDTMPSYDFTPVYSAIDTGSYAISSFQGASIDQFLGLNSYSIPNSSLSSGSGVATALQTMQDTGFIGAPVSYGNSSSSSGLFGSVTSFLAPLANFVSDPVNTITGEFYVDAVDLKLNGPMPLEIRRTYGSQNLANNSFGYGWKLAYFPYLDVSSDSSMIYAAEQDGSVVAYRRQASGTRWIPQPADNPQLANATSQGLGGTTNLYNNRIDVSTNGQTYTLTGADGGIRTFVVASFPTGGTSSVDRQRPYLQKWADNRGNYYTFSFGASSASTDYGQLNRVTSSNGDYVGFNYDTSGHIVE